MSFITEVFISNDDEEDTDCELVECKKKIDEYINDVYHVQDDWSKKKQKLLDATKELTGYTANLQQQIEVTKNVDQVDAMSSELNESISKLKVITKLIVINDLLLKIEELIEKKRFIPAGEELLKVEEFLNGMPKNERIEVIAVLTEEVIKAKKNLTAKLGTTIEKVIKIKVGGSKIVQVNAIRIKKNYNETGTVLNLLYLLGNCNCLKSFSKSLWKHILKPVILNNTVVKSSEDLNYYMLNVTKRSAMKLHYNDIFNKIINVFQFLKARFSYKSEGFSSVGFIANEIRDSLFETLFKECLNETVPVTDEMYHLYKDVIASTKRFQREMVRLEILTSHHNILLKYIDNMDMVYINKICNQYLGDAIALMKKDLQNSVFVGTAESLECPLKLDQFPESCISRSTLELMDLTGKLLHQAIREPPLSAGRLICTLQSIFYQYGNIVCGHNDRLLQFVPKMVALFRNNCMYIAHQLIKFNRIYGKKFSPASLPDPLLFTEHAHQLRTLGGEIFLAYVEEHVKQMEITLEQWGFDSVHISTDLEPDTACAIKTCLKQYDVLKFVWKKTLPFSVFQKTLGYIVNSFCKKLVDIVLATPSIPYKNALKLDRMFQQILLKGPTLFNGSQDIRVYVDSWQKFNGIVFAMGASEEEISLSWDHGKGPLTLCFTQEEIKKIVSALYPNYVFDF